MSNLHKNIKKLRQEQGISQDKLSKLANVSLNTIVKLELRINPNPKLETVKKIADALSVTIDSLIK